MSASIRIVNGEVYDPKNSINGEIKEICIEDGKIVDSVSDEATIIDAKGMVIMPGGVDIPLGRRVTSTPLAWSGHV